MRIIDSLLKKNGALAIIDQAAFSGTNFIVTILLAHSMNSMDFGIMASITLITYLFIGVTNALIIQPLQVTLSHVPYKKKYIDFNIYSQILLVSFISVIALLTGLSVSVGNFIFPATAFCAALLIFDTLRKILLANDNPLSALIADTVAGAIQLIALVLLYSLNALDLISCLMSLALSYAAGSFVCWIILKPSFKIEKNLWLGWATLHGEQGKWLLVAAGVQWAAANLFVLMSGYYLGAASLGAFRVVQSLFGVINLVFQSFENYIIPKAARILTDSKEEARKYLLNIGLKSLGIFGGLLSLLFVFADRLIVVAGGDQYKEFGFVIQGMSLLYLVILIGYPVRMSIRILSMSRPFFSGYMASFIFSVATSWLLLPYGGLAGAIIGLIVNQLIIIVIWQYSLSQRNFYLWKSSI